MDNLLINLIIETEGMTKKNNIKYLIIFYNKIDENSIIDKLENENYFLKYDLSRDYGLNRINDLFKRRYINNKLYCNFFNNEISLNNNHQVVLKSAIHIFCCLKEIPNFKCIICESKGIIKPLKLIEILMNIETYRDYAYFLQLISNKKQDKIMKKSINLIEY